MLSKYDNKTQPTNNWHILGVNTLSVIKPVTATLKMSVAGGIWFAGWLATLPLTLTGAVFKTIVDINTRKKMSVLELNTTIENVEKLDGEAFDRFVDTISLYKENAKSNSSRQIFTQLELAQKEKENKIQKCQLREEKVIKQKEISNMKQQLEENFNLMAKPNFHVNFDTSYELSSQDNQEVKEKVEKSIPQFEEERREMQKEKIIGFLREPYNAGKKLQHVIKKATEEHDDNIKFEFNK